LLDPPVEKRRSLSDQTLLLDSIEAVLFVRAITPSNLTEFDVNTFVPGVPSVSCRARDMISVSTISERALLGSVI